MIMLKINIFAVLMFWLYSVGVSQNTELLNGNLNENSNRLNGKLMGEVYYLNAVINANYFLQKDWTAGTITLKDGDVFRGIKMRYMAYGDELVAYNSNIRSLFIVDKTTVKEFTFNPSNELGNQTERKFINLDSLHLFLNRSYFEELYSGTVKFLAFHQIEEYKTNPYIDTGGKMSDSEFKLRTTYYILSDTKGISKIQLKNRSVYTIYPENKKAIKKLLRKSKIRITNEISAIQAFDILGTSGLLK